MRVLWLVLTLTTAAQASAYEHFASPDGKLEAYTTANWPDGTGMKLFLRRAQAHDAGTLLWKNNRWIDAKWSPDSRFLAVVDHFDGHISNVYVFGVATADAEPRLLYHTPGLGTYDVKWEVMSWDVARREIILRKQVKHKTPDKITHEKVTARIGSKPLKLEESH